MLRRVPLLLRAQLAPFAGSLQQSASMSAAAGPTTATPPPDTARGATADLCDAFITESVDVVSQRKVQILEPVFRRVRPFGGGGRPRMPGTDGALQRSGRGPRAGRHRRKRDLTR